MGLTQIPARDIVQAMNIRLNDSEVHTLIDMISLASMVADWNQEKNVTPRLAAFHALEEKIFENLMHNGYEDLIEYVEEDQRHDVTDAFEQHSSCLDFYTEFREESFWDELVVHMADRDLIQRIGEAKFNRMGEIQRRKMTEEMEKRYWQEVEKNGVANFHIVHPQGG